MTRLPGVLRFLLLPQFVELKAWEPVAGASTEPTCGARPAINTRLAGVLFPEQTSLLANFPLSRTMSHPLHTLFP